MCMNDCSPQWLVQTSLYQPTEESPTVTPPSREQWTPQLSTSVSLATWWLGWQWGRVLLVDGALEMIPSVLVRVFSVLLNWCGVCVPPAICPELPTLANGTISYSPNNVMIRRDGAIATHSCDSGYTLSGDQTRTCQANRDWSGLEPACNSEYTVISENLTTMFVVKLVTVDL